MDDGIRLVDRLRAQHTLSPQDYVRLLTCTDGDTAAYLRGQADAVRRAVYGDAVYIRGLIEFTNYCRNDCYYCGIRRSNRRARRFRLTPAQILACAASGYAAGFRTFVLQGGEDPYFTDERMVELIRSLRGRYPDCAITLSVGEKPPESYQAYFDAGADRYLLRHETADPAHYARLHPPGQSLDSRLACLRQLKAIGFQVGCGFMVGSPGQTPETIAADLRLIGELRPQMVGIGPFIPHRDTPFRDQPAGSAALTVRLLSIIRLMLPAVLLPTTTALGTIAPDGREQGLLAGANVIMPNLSPPDVRGKYLLYDNKLCTGDEAAENVAALRARVAALGYRIVTDRGDARETRPS